MHVDESYAEYVAARWSMLYRLAVLLAGEHRADELAQDALVRAYLTWPHGRDDEPPEDQVKALLARGALAGPEPLRSPGTTLDATTLDATTFDATTLDALPRRQRVVVVLRCFEYLADGDIARMLGLGQEAVANDAAAALAALALTEAEVTAVLTRAADDAGVPLPPVEALLEGGHEARSRRSRRVRRWAAATAAGLVLALAAGTYLQSHPGNDATRGHVSYPSRLSALRPGADPRVPFAELDTLHLAGGKYVVLEAVPTAVVPAGRWTYAAFSSGTIVRVDDTSLRIEPVTDKAAGPPVADRLGRYVAWPASFPGAPFVEIRPTEPRTNAHENQTTLPDIGAPVDLAGVTPTADVIASAATLDRAWVWHAANVYDRAGSVRQIEGLGNGEITQVTPGEVVVRYPPNHFAVGRLDGDAFLAREDLVASNADFADPRGKRIVYATPSGEIRVGRRGDGTDRDRSHDLRLRLPRLPAGYFALAWEDDHDVLLDVTDASVPDGALVRCDVDTGACEIAYPFEQTLHVLGH